MKRMAFAALLLGLFLLANTSLAQSSKEAIIKYRGDSGKEESISGVISNETLSGITFRGAKGKKTIPAEDIIEVDYPTTSTIGLARTKAKNAEHDRKYETAITEYKKMKVSDDSLARHIEYKIAYLTAKLAEADGSPQGAIDRLNGFLKKYPNSWQAVNFPELLVPLQVKAGDIAGAKATLDAIASQRNVPAGLAKKIALMRTKILVDSKQYAEAEQELAKLIAESKDESMVLKFRMQRAECLAATKGKLKEARSELNSILAKTKSAEVKAAALNTLGECLRKNGQAREAMWDFLFVDVLYNQSKDEHFRAIRNLAEVFDELKDSKRAAEYKALLKGK